MTSFPTPQSQGCRGTDQRRRRPLRSLPAPLTLLISLISAFPASPSLPSRLRHCRFARRTGGAPPAVAAAFPERWRRSFMMPMMMWTTTTNSWRSICLRVVAGKTRRSASSVPYGPLSITSVIGWIAEFVLLSQSTDGRMGIHLTLVVT